MTKEETPTEDRLRGDLERQWERDIECSHDRLPAWYLDPISKKQRRDAWVNTELAKRQKGPK